MKAQRGQAPRPEPWARLAGYLPKGFSLTREGVYSEGSTPCRIAGPCWVSEQTHSPGPKEWGRVIHWLDPDAGEHQQAFPDQMLHERGAPLAGILRSLGLMVVPGEERRLIKYLGSWEVPHRLTSVGQVGWHRIDRDECIFVLPNEVIGGTEGAVVYQPEQFSQTASSIRTAGSLQVWQEQVAAPAADHPLLCFALCTPFAGPLLHFVGMDSGGFNLVGPSSRGKTTALGIAASVWGAAGEPGTIEDPYILSWNQTLNAFEGTAAAHNDALLVLDELGQCDPFDLARVIYSISGGQGRQRLNRNATLASRKTWRLMLLSSGEITVAEKLLEARQRPQAGQQVRLIDVPIGDGLFETSSREEAEKLARGFKRACAKYYGHAGPQFIRGILEMERAQGPLDGELRRQVEDWTSGLRQHLAPGRNLETHQHRALRRFAVIAVAGELALDLKVLPLEGMGSGIKEGIQAAARAWLGSAAAQSEGQLALAQVAAFIRANEARFRCASTPATDDRSFRELAGYWKSDGDEKLWLFDDRQLAEACRPYAYQSALDEAERRGGLFKNEASRRKSRHDIKGWKRPWLYALRQSCLEATGSSLPD